MRANKVYVSASAALASAAITACSLPKLSARHAYVALTMHTLPGTITIGAPRSRDTVYTYTLSARVELCWDITYVCTIGSLPIVQCVSEAYMVVVSEAYMVVIPQISNF